MVSTSFEGGSVTDDECGEVGGDLRRLPAVFRILRLLQSEFDVGIAEGGVQYVDVTLHGFRVSDTRLRQPNIIL